MDEAAVDIIPDDLDALPSIPTLPELLFMFEQSSTPSDDDTFVSGDSTLYGEIPDEVTMDTSLGSSAFGSSERLEDAKNAFLVSPSHKHPESCERQHETVEYSLRDPGVCIICKFVSSMHIALGSCGEHQRSPITLGTALRRAVLTSFTKT